MNKKTKIALAVVVLMVLMTVAIATAYYYSLYYPQTVTVPITATYGLEVYINGAIQANETTIAWETVDKGTSKSYDLDVKNVGNTDVNVTLVLGTLPAGISEVWSADNKKAIPGDWVNGTLTLTISEDFSAGTYPFDSWVQAIPP